MNKICLIFICLFITLPAHAQENASDNLQIARAAYATEDYRTALHHYMLSAQNGDPQAQFELAKAHEDGINYKIFQKMQLQFDGLEGDVETQIIDHTRAHIWYTIASLNGQQDAADKIDNLGPPRYSDVEQDVALMVGRGYATGNILPKNCDRAGNYFRRALSLGNEEVLYDIGYSFETGCGEKQNYETALDFYQRCLDEYECHGTGSEYRIGQLYENGWGVDQDYKKAYEWYQKALYFSGTREAILKLYQFSKDGLGTNKDMEQANLWISIGKSYGNFKKLVGSKRVDGFGKSHIAFLYNQMTQNMTKAQLEQMEDRTENWFVED